MPRVFSKACVRLERWRHTFSNIEVVYPKTEALCGDLERLGRRRRIECFVSIRVDLHVILVSMRRDKF